MNTYSDEMINPNFDLLKCNICKNLLQDIEECENCHNLFCINCVNKEQKNNKSCPICKVIPFKTKRNTLMSELIKEKKIKVICQFCQKRYESLNEYEKHIPECPTEHYYCKKCSYNTLSEEDLWSHLLKEHEKNIIEEMKFQQIE